MSLVNTLELCIVLLLSSGTRGSSQTEKIETSTLTQEQESGKHFPVAAIVGIVVGALLIITIVILILHCRKKKSKKPPLDDVNPRFRSDSLFGDDGSVAVIHNNSLFLPTGADSTGYYHKPTVQRSSSEIRVPQKQLFRGASYSGNHRASTESINFGNNIEWSTKTRTEEATFVY